MNPDLEFHRFAQIFPMLEAGELQSLADSIKEKGFDKKEPIVKFEGKILDGRNRYTACKMAGVKPSFTEYTGDDPLGFSLQKNLHRRHLSLSQLAMVAAEVRTIYDEEAKERQKRKPEDSVPATLPEQNKGKKGDARDKAGKSVGVGGKSVDHASTVKEFAAPEIAAAVIAGEVKVSDAAKIAKKSKSLQLEALQLVRDGRAKTLAQAAKRITDTAAAASHAAMKNPSPDDEPAEEPEIPRDKNGEPWPAIALPGIEAAKSLDAFRRKILTCIDDVKAMNGTQLGRHIDFVEMESALTRMKKACLAGKPEYVCPYCDGKGKKEGACKPCRGHGWVDGSTYLNSPKANGAQE